MLIAVRVMTNGDYIRSCTDEELAEILSGWERCYQCRSTNTGACTNGDCTQGRLAWLKEPYDEKKF